MKLAVILAFLFSGIDAHIPITDPCDNLKVTTEITHTTDGLDNGEVEVKVEGGVGPYSYFFTNSKGYPKSFDLKNNSFKNVAQKEDLWVSVVDSKGCVVKIQIEVE